MAQYSHLTYKYLNEEQQYFVKAILNNNFEASNLILKVKKYFKGVIRKEKTPNSKKIFIWGHLIYSKQSNRGN